MWESELANLLPREEGARELKLATMTSQDSLRLGKLELRKEDLLISEQLKNRLCVKAQMRSSSSGGPCTDESVYLEPLKSGDTVLIYQLSDSKFVILDKVVSL